MTEEIWKSSREFPWLQVSNKGGVRTMDRVIKTKRGQRRYRGCVLKPQPTLGYPHIVVQLRGLYVHRMVAQAFVENPNNAPHVNHKNGVRSDNYSENLEWVTSKENHIHRCKVLKRGIGSQQGGSKLTEIAIPEIRRLRANGVPVPVIASRYMVGTGCIYDIFRGKSWKHVA